MGIQGLTSFVDNHPELLTDFELHDIKVIIDGNNLYHFLYYYFGVEHMYGGDYAHYANCVKKYFTCLEQCSIEPVVIFDGAYNTDDRKLKTVLKRATDRIHLAGFLSYGKRGKILPILAFETFRQVLNEMNVKHYTCDFEADSQIAALANKWNCPVMSNDSDFFIYDVKGGFILFDYLDLKAKEGKHTKGKPFSYLPSQIYYLNTLLEKFTGLGRESIPLFATLLGTDTMEAKQFEIFFSRSKLPVPDNNAFSKGKRFQKMVSLLYWLESAETVDNATDEILDLMPEGNRIRVHAAIKKSMESYTALTTTIDNEFDLEKYESRSSNSKSFPDYPLPDWFIKSFRAGWVPVMNLNAVVVRRIILLSQVEVMVEPSAYQCALKLRQYIYGILMSGDESQVLEDDVLKAKSIAVEEYNRVEKILKCSHIEAVSTLPSGRALPNIWQIPALSTEDTLDVLLDLFQVEKSKFKILCTTFPPNMQLFALSLVWWIRNACPEVSKYHLMALVVGALKLGALDIVVPGINTRDQEGKTDENLEDYSPDQIGEQIQDRDLKHDSYNAAAESLLDKAKSGSTQEEIQFAKEKLQKFEKAPRHRNSSQFKGRIIHAFSQFQACFQFTTYLNMLLQKPLQHPNPALLFSGTFLYSLAKELQVRIDHNLYVHELLGRSSTIGKLYQEFIDLISSFVHEDSFCAEGKKASKRAKKNKARKAGKSRQKEGTKENIVDQSEIHLEGNELTTACDLSNRFGGIALDVEC